MEEQTVAKSKSAISNKVLLKAYKLMCQARAMSDLYEENKAVTSKYVHATSKGHEAIQLAAAFQLNNTDYVYPYYRDDSILLGIGMKPYDLMLQLLAKKSDPFSGGRTYYSHPSLRDDDKPKIPHQSSATGMQAIPATGAAMGIQYKELQNISETNDSVVICSLGDASVTEGEVAEAFQMAALKQLPIIYLIQDNEWDISASADEIRAQNAFDYIKGFKGVEAVSINGSDFEESYTTMKRVVDTVRKERRPFLVHAKVPLLNHHTSGVRMEWYRDDLEEHKSRDPFPLLKAQMEAAGIGLAEIINIEVKAKEKVAAHYQDALKEEDPTEADLYDHIFADSPITEETGVRAPEGKESTVMVDSALFAVQEIMEKHPESLLYGQDVGARLGGVFREAATLAQKFGDNRVFNTPIQEAFIIGSTVGMAAVGCKPIVEVQFADYIWPGLNQLFTEVSRSNYLSNGKWPASAVLRVPIGAYGSGGPYHSSSVESVLANIKGIKIAYPSTGADLKGLMKSAYYDPNPVVMLEHKGLYWSKIKGTEDAKTIEPDEDYVIPFGKGRVVQEADSEQIANGKSIAVITYGMGVYWSKTAAKAFNNQVEIIDLRTIHPLDEELVLETAKKHGRCLIVTEEPSKNTFAQSIAALVSHQCFEYLDAPVQVIGSENTPAIPLNSNLEFAMIPNAQKVEAKINEVLNY